MNAHLKKTRSAVALTMLASLVLSGCSSAPASTQKTTSVESETTAELPTQETMQNWLWTKMTAETLSYNVPKGNVNQITVGLTVDENGIITDYDIKNVNSNPISAGLHKQFEAGISEQLIGKPLEWLDIGVVNGASLTSAAFTLALASLK